MAASYTSKVSTKAAQQVDEKAADDDASTFHSACLCHRHYIQRPEPRAGGMSAQPVTGLLIKWLEASCVVACNPQCCAVVCRYMEPECKDLMMDAIAVNYIDTEE